MGLPMDRLVVATNSNDILARFWKTGRYERVELDLQDPKTFAIGAPDGKQCVDAAAKESLSPAMDILVSSNFERLLWYLAYEMVGGEVDVTCDMVQSWMKRVKSDGRVELPQTVLELARRDFIAERVSDDQVGPLKIGCCTGVE